jgi:hypothetical protein
VLGYSNWDGVSNKLRERFLSLNQRQFTTEITESTEILKLFLCGLCVLRGKKGT